MPESHSIPESAIPLPDQCRKAAENARKVLGEIRRKWLGAPAIRGNTLRDIDQKLRAADKAAKNSQVRKAVGIWSEACGMCLATVELAARHFVGRFAVSAEHRRLIQQSAELIQRTREVVLRETPKDRSGTPRAAKCRFSIHDSFEDLDLTCRRREFADSYIAGMGLEIGALHRPLPVNEKKARVKYVDYKSLEENRKRYPELADQEIVTTDLIDDGFCLSSIPDGSQDFIIANHALEHSPDPWGTLETWLAKLRPSGIIYATIPIAAKCYDRGRPITTLRHLKDDHMLFSSIKKEAVFGITMSHLEEFLSISGNNIRAMNNLPPVSVEECRALHDLLANGLLARFRTASTYHELILAHVECVNRIYDVHYHTFTPSSYAEFLEHFCDNHGAILENVVKNGGGEAIGIVRKAP